tara:strand:- start:674 stop:919 length:246 start_codon:yes stop_codon:yes gene_type:complete
MKFDTESYINTLLDKFARNHAYHSYLNLKKCKRSDNYFALYTKNLLSEEYQLYSIIKENVSGKKSDKKVSWDTKLHIEYNY